MSEEPTTLGIKPFAVTIAGITAAAIAVGHFSQREPPTFPYVPFAYRVVDGDTIATSYKPYTYYRIVGYDTPETYSPKCMDELVKGLAATKKVRELLAAGPVEWKDTGRSDLYNRRLVEIKVDGKDLKDHLVPEGLAVPYSGRGRRTKDWCASAAELKSESKPEAPAEGGGPGGNP